MVNKVNAALLAASVCGGALCTTAAFASSLNMLLVRSTLSNDADADGGGLYQYEGGVVENGGGTTAIGHYIVTRRVTTSGTSADNTAGETITLFFPNSVSGNVPNNITLTGAYSYNNGQFAGSVSAVSARYRLLNGDDATAAITTTAGTSKLTINYDGVNNVP